VSKIDPRFRVEFSGVDQDRQADAEVYAREVTNFKTVNELRAELGMPPIPGGDIILNTMYVAPAPDQTTDPNLGQTVDTSTAGQLPPQA
jgi:hypothetical protein